jgi:hypothetical protein
MAATTELVVALGRVISTSLKGSSNAVLGNLTSLEGIEDDPDAETSGEEPIYGTLGLYGRAAPPVKIGAGAGNSPAGSVEFVGLRVGDQVFPVAYRDLRLNAKVNPKAGEVGIVQYKGGFIALKDNATADGTDVTIYAVHNNGAGVPDKAHAIHLDSSTANASISIMHSYGHSISLNKTGSVVVMNKAGDAMVEVNDDGVTINGAKVAITGGAMLGDSNPANGDFVMLATQLLVWIAQAQLAITTMAAVFNIAPPGTPMLSLGAGAVVPPVAVPLPSTKVKASMV